MGRRMIVLSPHLEMALRELRANVATIQECVELLKCAGIVVSAPTVARMLREQRSGLFRNPPFIRPITGPEQQ